MCNCSYAVAHFPGSFQLVMAANPCPCGQWGAKDSTCTCAPFARRRYLARISGPLLDRIDIQLRVSRVTSTQLKLADDRPRLTSAIARERVARARGGLGVGGGVSADRDRGNDVHSKR